MDTSGDGMKEAGEKFTDSMNDAGEKITEGFNEAVAGAQEALSQLQNSDAFKNASDTLEETLVKAQEVLGDLYQEVKEQLEQFVDGMRKDQPGVASGPEAVEGGSDPGPTT